jgi:hypothetical protein
MDTEARLIKKYATFEAELRACMAKFFGDHCCVCQAVCCKPEFCEESLSSPFLRRVRRHFAPDAVYDVAHGWLTATGCALPVGRPPVCYQFFCRAILDMQLTAQSRYAIAVLSNLVAHVGKNVHGRKHVVELENASQLKDLKWFRFEKQLDAAAIAFDLVRAYLDGEIAELHPSPALMQISTVPAWIFPRRSGHASGGYPSKRASRHRLNCAPSRLQTKNSSR